MAKTVVGLFRSQEEARSVVEDLIQAGCRREDLSLVAKNERDLSEAGEEEVGEKEERGTKAGEGAATGAGIGAVLGGIGGILVGLGVLAIPGVGPIIAAGPVAATLAGAAGGAVAGGLIGGLVGLGIPEEEAGHYAEGVRRGHTLVIAKTSDAEADSASAVMNRHNPIDLHTEAAKWRAEGWSGRTYEGAASSSIPVTQEELTVSKRAFDTGGVRIHSHVTEQPVTADVRLHQERVQVERMPADRPVSDADRAFQDRSIEARETNEEAVVGKTARVVEEVQLRKEGEDREERIEDKVRRTDVEVERLPGNEPRPQR
ncbi:MAG TPA: YsnF/AvaK domain-containing protein [Magnetospirillum sp.]|nr:YsnF/AvaK domain-containing protein [Magnetospirillum sp.]